MRHRAGDRSVTKQPNQNGQAQADHDGTGHGQVEPKIASLNQKIAGKPAQSEFSEKRSEQAGDEEKDADQDQEFGHAIR